MKAKREKTVRFLTPQCKHGTSVIELSDGEQTHVGPVKHVREGAALPPGHTLIHVEADDSREGYYRVTSEFTTPGPAQVATDEYRAGWDQIFGKRDQSELN